MHGRSPDHFQREAVVEQGVVTLIFTSICTLDDVNVGVHIRYALKHCATDVVLFT